MYPVAFKCVLISKSMPRIDGAPQLTWRWSWEGSLWSGRISDVRGRLSTYPSSPQRLSPQIKSAQIHTFACRVIADTDKCPNKSELIRCTASLIELKHEQHTLQWSRLIWPHHCHNCNYCRRLRSCYCQSRTLLDGNNNRPPSVIRSVYKQQQQQTTNIQIA